MHDKIHLSVSTNFKLKERNYFQLYFECTNFLKLTFHFKFLKTFLKRYEKNLLAKNISLSNFIFSK